MVSLVLLWNEDRLRRNPSGAWRVRPLTALQRKQRWLQLLTAILTLLLIVTAEVVTHSLFHH